MFEQSGTFKNEFIKLGIPAYDYDILDDFGQTDFKVDLFDEIDKAFEHKESIFDNIKRTDLIFAFFPCTRFEAKIPLSFRGELFQEKNWSQKKKLTYAMDLHTELHRNYMLISELVVICIDRGLQLIIENPYTQPHYLTQFWSVKPSIIDKDRRDRGDYMKKPTQYYFINREVRNNIIFEPIEYVEQLTIDHITATDQMSRQVRRSMIHHQYANRFIREHILDTDGNL